MKVLIAHGDAGSRYALREMARDLSALGLEPVESDEGERAVELLLADGAPGLAVVDWDLPGLDGPELCRRVRARRRSGAPYIILLHGETHPVAEGLDAGADDCVEASASDHELQARIIAGRRFSAQL